MPHFLIQKEQIINDVIRLENDDNFFHIVKVLRTKVGETIKFIDKDKQVYIGEVTKTDKNFIEAKIIKKYLSERYLKNNICLVQCVLMNDAQNLLIANATQTGVKEIYPVISDNISPPISSLKNKKQKWEKIAYENFKQCERADSVKINDVIPLVDALSQFKKQSILIYAEKYADTPLDSALKDMDKNEKIAVVIGPEGGFSQSEFEYFKQQKLKLVSLGSMIYKAPNAVVAGIHGIVCNLENI